MELHKATKKYAPYLFVVFFVLALLITVFLDDPLLSLQQIFLETNFKATMFVYFLATVTSTIVLPFTVAAIVPFAAKVLGAFPVFIATWVGWLVGACIAFYLQKKHEDLARKLYSKKELIAYEEGLPRKVTAWDFFTLRLFSHADSLSYASAKENVVSFSRFVVLSALGFVPLAFILSYGPDALTGDSRMLFFTFMFFVLVVLGAFLFVRFFSIFGKKMLLVTHDGRFHTDDVFACASLELFLKQQRKACKVLRISKSDNVLHEEYHQLAKDGKAYIFDVGGKYEPTEGIFDHHQQEGAGVRANGLPYASFGLVWKHIGGSLCDSKEIAERLDKRLAEGIDAADNGIVAHLEEGKYRQVRLYEIVEDVFRPTLFAPTKQDFNNNFAEAVEFAKDVLQRSIKSEQVRIRKEKEVEDLYHKSQNKALIVSEVAWGKDYFTKYSDTRMVVSKRSQDGDGESWGIVIIPTEYEGLDGRMSFPKSWWGKRDTELQEVSGVSDAIFCHKSGNFLAGAQSREGAIKMAEIALKEWANS